MTLWDSTEPTTGSAGPAQTPLNMPEYCGFLADSFSGSTQPLGQKVDSSQSNTLYSKCARTASLVLELHSTCQVIHCARF